MKTKLLLLSGIVIITVTSASAQPHSPAAKAATVKTVIAKKKSNAKYTLVDSITLSPVSETEYDEAGNTKNRMIYLFKKEHWGIAKKTGEVLINPDTSKYRYIDDKLDSAGNYLAYLFDAERKNFLGDMVLLNKQYKQVTSRAYNFIMSFKQGYYMPYQRAKNNTENIFFGLLTKDGKEILKPVYKLITINNAEGLIFTIRDNGKHGLYNTAGKTILPDEYTRIKQDDLDEGKYIEVSKGGLTGLIDKKGKIIVPVKYSSLSYNDYGAKSFYTVEINDKKGILGLGGKVIINPEYEEIFPQLEEGCSFFSCSRDGQNWGWIDLTGKIILPLIYKDVVDCPGKEGLSRAKISDSAYIFINKAGQSMFNKKFKDASSFNNGTAPVKEKDKYGILNSKGIYIVQPSYDEIVAIYNSSDYSHELYAVKKDNKWGFMDKSGQLVTPVVYDNPSEESNEFSLSEGLMAVSLNNKWGFINKSGKTIIPFTYDSVSSFTDGKAQVRIDKETFYIDKSGVKQN